MVEEEGEGDDFGAGVVAGAIGEVAVGELEDQRGEAQIFCAQVDGQGGSEAFAVDDDGLGWDTAGGRQVG